MPRIVNVIPRSLSAEARQDSEPNIAVNPEDPNQIVATAFARDPGGGQLAPVFVSRDGGETWELRLIVPGGLSTRDITVGFGTRGGALYAGTLTFADAKLNILRTDNPFALTPMTVLVERDAEDQPWTTAATTGADGGQDRVYIGHNDRNPAPHTASVFSSQDARTPAAPAGFATGAVERRDTAGVDGPPVRPAVHPDGTVYAAFQRWVDLLAEGSTFLDLNVDVVVVRDDAFASGANPFSALVDPNDGTAGIRVATDRFVHFTAKTGPLGQERIGADMAIAVDPTTSDNVWIAWCDRVGGQAATDWTIHVRRSTDRAQTWSDDLRTVTNAKNPALAVNDRGLLGFMFQQLVGTGATARWVTQLELTAEAFAPPVSNFILHTALFSEPPRDFLPYLGDYIRLVTVGEDFYGVFSGSNLPDMTNFPNGVTYQRNANFDTHTLLGTDNVTPVDISIDPFFVHHSPGS
jgi:hypothetical protein